MAAAPCYWLLRGHHRDIGSMLGECRGTTMRARQAKTGSGEMVIVIMGVTGAGKTTVGRLLAAQLGWVFFDADDFHPKANREKMRIGQPLTDADRAPWLAALRVLIADCLRQGRDAVIACSALKAAYRAQLQVDVKQVAFVFLTGDPNLVRARLSARKGHFMPASLLESQIALLEEPPDGLRVDWELPPEAIVAKVRESLGLV